MRIGLALLVAFAAPAVCGPTLGVISFPNTGNRTAQEPFLRGVLLLHNFEYDDAAAAFRDAQDADPGFVLSYWGEALTYYRPVWGREELDDGRKALRKAANAEPADARERAYLDAVRILFGDGSRAERWKRYSHAMERLYRSFPNDLEAASLYAVSLFGITGGRDHRTYMRIASIAQDVHRGNRDHPGALHYLIHSFDDPVHAPLGLQYARRYAEVASSAPHAQHMPSHIFLALGMWDECVSSNIDSWNSSEARVRLQKLGTDERGYHALWWLQYGYLQMGRFDKARRQLAIIEADAAKSGSRHARNHHAYLRSNYIVDSEQWDADLAPVDDNGIDHRAWGANALAEGLRALHRGDLDLSRNWLEKLRARAESYGDKARSLPVAALELGGMHLLEAGSSGQAVEKLREAARLEEQTPFGYGPPFPVKPAFELLGEAMLALEKPEEALRAFQSSLKRTPRRARGLLGLHRAAIAAGDSEAARLAKTELADYQSTP